MRPCSWRRRAPHLGRDGRPGRLLPQRPAPRWRARRSASARPGSALFAASTTGTSTGAVNAMHDSLTAPGGGVAIVNMMLGEIAPGGVGSGLYGMVMLAIVTVFLAGLMVGRTPGVPRQEDRPREIVLVALYILIMPAVVLIGTALAISATPGWPGSAEAGPHGLSEACTPSRRPRNNNGVAFAGLTAGTPFWNTLLGLCMLLGRFLPIVSCWPSPAVSPASAGPGQRRHAADPQAAVRRPARRRGPGRGRTDLRPRPRPRSDRGVPVVTTCRTSAPDHADRPLPAAPSASSTRAADRTTPVMLVVEVGAVVTTVLAVARPERLRLSVTRLAVADGALRDPRRVRRRGPRQGPGGEPAGHPAGDDGPQVAAPPTARDRQADALPRTRSPAQPAGRRRRRRRGRGAHPRRR